MIPSTDTLKAQLQAHADEYRSEDHRVRLWRAISWLERAAQAKEDPDSVFIYNWIAFNALYAMVCSPEAGSQGERERFAQFLKEVVNHDQHRHLHSILMLEFKSKAQPLLNTPFMLYQFWQHVQDPTQYSNWETILHKSRDRAKYALQNRETDVVLQILFDRLYVLRNQIIHGGATYGSQLNRTMVENASALLGALVPVITHILVNNPAVDLGPVFFPVIKEAV